MRFLYGIVALFIVAGFITYAKTQGVIVSNDAELLCMTIAFAGGMAGGD